MNDDRPLIGVMDLVTSVGGTQYVMASVLPRLAEQFRVVVLNAYNHAEYAAMFRGTNVEVATLGRAPRRPYIGGRTRAGYLLRAAARGPWFLKTMWRLRRWVIRNRPSLMYFNQVKTGCLFAQAIPTEVPLIFHSHGHRGPEEITPRQARILSDRFAAAIAVSKITGRILASAGVREDKIQIIYNGVDADGIERRAGIEGPELPPKTPGEVVFVAVCSIGPLKGLHIAIDAICRLGEEPSASLWICGGVASGGDENYLQQLHAQAMRLGLTNRVRFLGWRADVPRVIAAADVCILPSLHSESFGLVLAEGMVLGKPCIGSNVGGVPEVIEDGVTGTVCQPTAESLAEAMKAMVESGSLRSALGEAGRQRVRKLFDVSRQADKVACLLRAAIERPKSDVSLRRQGTV